MVKYIPLEVICPRQVITSTRFHLSKPSDGALEVAGQL